MITSDTPRRFRITLWRVLGLVFLLLILLFVVARIHVRRDIHRQLAEIRQSGGLMTLMDLQARYQDIDGRHNGAFDLIAVASHLNGIEEKLRREGRTNDAFYELPFLPKGEPPPKGARLDPALLDSIAEALGRTGDAFDQLHVILARTNQAYVHTMNLSLGLSAPMTLTHLSPLKTTSQWLALKAVYDSSTQKPDEAVVALLDGLRLARSLEREPILISQLVRLSMLRISIRSLEWVLDQAELAPNQLNQLRSGLQSANPDGAMAIGLAGERCFGLDVLWYHREQFDPADTPAFLAYRVLGLADLDLKHYLSVMNPAVALSTNDLATRLIQSTNLIARNDEGKTDEPRWAILSSMLLPSFETAFNREADTVAAVIAADTALAVELFRIGNDGRLPGGLSDLVPEYLAEAPLDPRTGQPLTLVPSSNGYTILGKDALFTIDRPARE
ncbi:MAG TPA: hypothetical protein VMS21_09965 [Methylomirabilota bacterium]|nr:hypothetical protein [Methylomirabilota bacterium]